MDMYSKENAKIVLSEVNDMLTCNLCKGYLIDATTITECLHSFCRSCIVKFLQIENHCPVCKTSMNKAKPPLKTDKTLQDMVYKLVPGLFQAEMKRRQEFYRKRPKQALSTNPEQRGEDTERTIFNPEEKMSISIEPLRDDPIAAPNQIVPFGINLDTEANNENMSNTEISVTSMKRYLLCPGMCRVDVLKKFIRNKYNVETNNYTIEILYKRVPLPDHYTLIDIGYIFSWQRNSVMQFFFRITENSKFKTDDLIDTLPQFIVQPQQRRRRRCSGDKEKITSENRCSARRAKRRKHILKVPNKKHLIEAINASNNTENTSRTTDREEIEVKSEMRTEYSRTGDAQNTGIRSDSRQSINTATVAMDIACDRNAGSTAKSDFNTTNKTGNQNTNILPIKLDNNSKSSIGESSVKCLKHISTDHQSTSENRDSITESSKINIENADKLEFMQYLLLQYKYGSTKEIQRRSTSCMKTIDANISQNLTSINVFPVVAGTTKAREGNRRNVNTSTSQQRNKLKNKTTYTKSQGKLASNQSIQQGPRYISKFDEDVAKLSASNIQPEMKQTEQKKLQRKRKSRSPMKANESRVKFTPGNSEIDHLQNTRSELATKSENAGLQSLITSCRIPSSLSITVRDKLERCPLPTVVPPVKNYIEILKLPDDSSNDNNDSVDNNKRFETKPSQSHSFLSRIGYNDSEQKVDQDLSDLARSLSEKIPLSTTISQIVGLTHISRFPDESPKMIQSTKSPEVNRALSVVVPYLKGISTKLNPRTPQTFQKIFEESLRKSPLCSNSSPVDFTLQMSSEVSCKTENTSATNEVSDKSVACVTAENSAKSLDSNYKSGVTSESEHLSSDTPTIDASTSQSRASGVDMKNPLANQLVIRPTDNKRKADSLNTDTPKLQRTDSIEGKVPISHSASSKSPLETMCQMPKMVPQTIASLRSSSLGLNYTVSVRQHCPSKVMKTNGVISPEKIEYSSVSHVPGSTMTTQKFKSPKVDPKPATNINKIGDMPTARFSQSLSSLSKNLNVINSMQLQSQPILTSSPTISKTPLVDSKQKTTSTASVEQAKGRGELHKMSASAMLNQAAITSNNPMAAILSHLELYNRKKWLREEVSRIRLERALKNLKGGVDGSQNHT